jgi:hypothetical protein
MYCEECGALITGNHFRGTRFCSRACFGKYRSRTRKGIPRPEVRGPQPERQRRKTLRCPMCEREFAVKQSQVDRRRFCCKDCQAAYQRIHAGKVSGSGNWNWVGGHDPYYGPNWRKQRREARKRDNYTCQDCGTVDQSKRKLDVHHIKPFRLFGLPRYLEANDLSNLVTLCQVCHGIREHAA